MKTLFNLGQVVATPGALTLLEGAKVLPITLIGRHICGDWGELPDEDVRENQFSVENGLRILSAYRVGHGKVWVITEADRSSTTILLPEEY